MLLNPQTIEPVNKTTTTPIDIVNTTTNYTAQFDNKNSISWTGIVLYQLQNTMKIWASKFPWEDWIAWTSDDCDTYNIALNNWQIWSACNLWAKIAFNGSNWWTYNNPNWSTTRWWDDNVNWKLYQWWRNKWFSWNDTTYQIWLIDWSIWLNSSTDTNLFVSWSTTWANTNIDTNWWWSLSDRWTYDWQTNKTLRKWPCPTWWHVPSAKEFQDACNAIAWITCTNAMTNTTVRTILMLPYAGYHNWSTALYVNQGMNGDYWSSLPSTTNGVNLFLAVFMLMIFGLWDLMFVRMVSRFVVLRINQSSF